MRQCPIEGLEISSSAAQILLAVGYVGVPNLPSGEAQTPVLFPPPRRMINDMFSRPMPLREHWRQRTNNHFFLSRFCLCRIRQVRYACLDHCRKIQMRVTRRSAAGEIYFERYRKMFFSPLVFVWRSKGALVFISCPLKILSCGNLLLSRTTLTEERCRRYHQGTFTPNIENNL